MKKNSKIFFSKKVRPVGPKHFGVWGLGVGIFGFSAIPARKNSDQGKNSPKPDFSENLSYFSFWLEKFTISGEFTFFRQFYFIFLNKKKTSNIYTFTKKRLW